MTKLPKRYEHEIEEILDKQANEFLSGNSKKRDLKMSGRYRKFFSYAKRYLPIGPGRKLILVLLFLIPILLISISSNGFLSAALWMIIIFLTIKCGAAFVNPNKSYEKRWRGKAIEQESKPVGINHLLDQILGRRRP